MPFSELPPELHDSDAEKNSMYCGACGGYHAGDCPDEPEEDDDATEGGCVTDEELAEEREALSPEDRAKVDALPTDDEEEENYCEACFISHDGEPCPMNAKRAETALKVLTYFAKNGGERIRGEKTLSPDMIEQNMSDLICDFAHLLDLHGLEMGEVLRRAKNHYDAEVRNKGEQSFYAE
jgi:hypothetical protein